MTLGWNSSVNYSDRKYHNTIEVRYFLGEAKPRTQDNIVNHTNKESQIMDELGISNYF